MATKNVHQGAASAKGERLTRHDRRVREREEAHRRAHDPKKEGMSLTSKIIGVLMVVAVAGALAFAALHNRDNTQANGTGSHGPALTNPLALNTGDNLLSIGKKAPPFVLRDTSGGIYSTGDALGHPVVVEFFATWCPVCHQETPVLHKLQATFKAKGVQVWTVLANPYGKNYELSGGKDRRLADRGDLAWYSKTYNANYPLLVDPQFATVNRYGVQGYPTLYIIDKAGKIAYANSGARPYAELSAAVTKALK